MKRRMGWEKPTDYAAEMAERAAAKISDSSDPARSDEGLRVGTDERVDEPTDAQHLGRRPDLRSALGLIVFAVFLLAGVVLAIGALLVVWKADPDNVLVGYVLDAADALDLRVFSRDDGLFRFSGSSAETQGALVNWGLGGVAWVVVGSLLDRLIRP